MTEEKQSTIKNLLLSYEGERILILTTKNLHYSCKLLKVTDDSILIIDKFGSEIILPFVEIAQITKKEEKNGY